MKFRTDLAIERKAMLDEEHNGNLDYDGIEVEKYNFEAMGAKGLKAHTEGHISDTYADSANDIGLSESAKKVLSKYVYYGIA